MVKVENKIRTLQFWYPNIPRRLVMAKGLSIQAKFVYMYMSCQSSSFEFFHEPMANELNIGTRTLSKYLAELVESGWITKGGQKFENGRLGAINYIVNTSPKKDKKKNTDVSKSACSNTDVSKDAPKYNSNTSIPINQDSPINSPIDNDNKEVDNKLSPVINEGRSHFVKPTIEEIAAYIKEKGYHIDAEGFYHYYESVGWKRGKTKMTKWKSALSTWEIKNRKEKKESVTEETQYPAGMDAKKWNEITFWMCAVVPRISGKINPETFVVMQQMAKDSHLLSTILKAVEYRFTFDISLDVMEVFKEELKNYQDEQTKST